jgi:hypothetical protein
MFSDGLFAHGSDTCPRCGAVPDHAELIWGSCDCCGYPDPDPVSVGCGDQERVLWRTNEREWMEGEPC